MSIIHPLHYCIQKIKNYIKISAVHVKCRAVVLRKPREELGFFEMSEK